MIVIYGIDISGPIICLLNLLWNLSFTKKSFKFVYDNVYLFFRASPFDQEMHWSRKSLSICRLYIYMHKTCWIFLKVFIFFYSYL